MGQERGLVPTPLSVGTADLPMEEQEPGTSAAKDAPAFQPQGAEDKKDSLETPWGALGWAGKKGEHEGILGEGTCGQQ